MVKSIMSGVKSIWGKVIMVGRGIVNYDGKDARRAVMEWSGHFIKALSNDNVKVAKHSVRKVGEEDGKPKYELRLKISSACIRHSLFEPDQPFHNPAILHAPKILLRWISSVAGLLRGYMFEAKGCVGIKRKSPVFITDAEQVNGTIPTFDIGVQCAPKTEKEDAEDASGLTMHFKEAICEVVYEFDFAIDLNLLQFISLSQRYDRLAVDPNYEPEYRKNLEQTLGSSVTPKGWYIYKTATNGLPEEGILLTQEQVVTLVQEFFQRLLGLCIQRGGGGYAKVQSVQVKHVSNPLTDLADDAPTYQVRTVEDLRLKPADVEVFYNRVSDEEAVALYSDLDEAEKIQKARAKEQKAEEKERKAAKKAAKG